MAPMMALRSSKLIKVSLPFAERVGFHSGIDDMEDFYRKFKSFERKLQFCI